ADEPTKDWLRNPLLFGEVLNFSCLIKSYNAETAKNSEKKYMSSRITLSVVVTDSTVLGGDLTYQNRFRLLVFGFSQFLKLRDRPIYDVGFEVLTVQQVFLRFIFEGRQYPVKG